MRTGVKVAAAMALVAGTIVPTAVASAQTSFGVNASIQASLAARICRPFPRTLLVIGLTADQRLICFNERAPQAAFSIGAVSGLTGDTSVVGIDYRVQDGNLYGLGNSGGIYILSTVDAAATKVGQFSVALTGTSFGVDFNPAANALRVVSDIGQNLRHPFNVGPAPGTPAATTAMDTALNYLGGANPALGIGGSAYTNNDLNSATSTTLFNIDASLDQVALQSPPNAGTMVATGKLGVDATGQVGFDVFSPLQGGVAVGNTALAALQVGGTSSLYGVDLLTGQASFRGSFGANQVVDLAIPLNQ
ncbi:MAG: DUF4394 domain-containing protein [Actinomycetota bacterium]